MRRSKKAVALLLALCLVLAFAVPALADSAQTATAGNSPKLPAIFQSFLEKLAANLGVEQSKLVDTVKQTAKQLVDEAVQQGKLKSDQAQKIKERIDQGKLFPIAHLLHPGKKAKAGIKGKRLDEVAQALGMSADELKAELRQGKKLSDIVQEKGLTLEQLRQKLIETRIQAIQQAVKDGKISQQQADKMIQRLQKKTSQQR